MKLPSIGVSSQAYAGISTPFILRPIATSLLALSIIAIGIAAYPFLPVAAIPNVDFPTVNVNVNLPGASAETMAAGVAQPLERQLGQIPDISQMTSSSGIGSTNISIQFGLDRNIDAAAQDVQAAITAAAGQLPKNLPSPPRYFKTNPADRPILIYAFQSDVLPMTTVDDYVENIIAQGVAQIAGVSEVDIQGQQKPAIRLEIDPARLAATGLSLEDVRAVVSTDTTNAPKGYFDGEHKAFTIFDNDQITEPHQFDNMVLAYRNGAAIRLKDVGYAELGAENIKSGAWEQNGKQGIEMPVKKSPTANVIETADRVKAAMPDLLAALPPSIHWFLVMDRTQTIRASVAEVRFTLLLTIALVVAVIFLFLRNLSATIIPGLAIPLSLVGTFAVMYLLGYSIDNLSLMAMTISVGFVVDDAIVMLENIYRHMEEGMKPMEAALKGASEISFTIVSISLSLIAVFIPLLLMGGVVGRLFREFSVTVTMTIVLSMVVSLTLAPMMCSRFLHHNLEQGRIYAAIERGFNAMFNFYKRTLDTALHHHRETFATFVVTVMAAVALYIFIPKGFFPQQDTGTLVAQLEGSLDTSYAELKRTRAAVAEVIARDPDVIGLGSPIGGGRAGNTAMINFMLKPPGERKASVDQVIARLRPQLAKLEGVNVFLQAGQDITVGGRFGKSQYQYTLQDANLDELNTWVPKVVDKLKSIPILLDVSTDQQLGAATATLTIDRDQAARFGIRPQVIDDTLYDAFGQRLVGLYYTQVNTYSIIMEVKPDMQGDVKALDSIYITSPLTNQQVPLSALAKVDTKPVTTLSIAHQGMFPAVTVTFNLGEGTALGDAVDAVNKAMVELAPPETLHATFQGTAQVFQSSLASQPYLIAAAILAVYVILGVLYESYVHPLTILSTLPSAGVGALLMLVLFHYDLSVVALIGVILLIGIVKKNGIMMIDFAISARASGAGPEEAIRQACHLRFRPILMTSAAALLGGVPLMLGGGAGSELRRPLGFAMVGGLLVSQVLTLYTTPVVFLYLERLQAWIARLRKTPEEATEHATA